MANERHTPLWRLPFEFLKLFLERITRDKRHEMEDKIMQEEQEMLDRQYEEMRVVLAKSLDRWGNGEVEATKKRHKAEHQEFMNRPDVKAFYDRYDQMVDQILRRNRDQWVSRKSM